MRTYIRTYSWMNNYDGVSLFQPDTTGMPVNLDNMKMKMGDNGDKDKVHNLVEPAMKPY